MLPGVTGLEAEQSSFDLYKAQLLDLKSQFSTDSARFEQTVILLDSFVEINKVKSTQWNLAGLG